MPALRKALRDLAAADFQALIDDQWIEDELLEFKKTLSTSDGRPDRWLQDGAEIGASAKRDLLAEVVAMANTYGGDVVLGIDETDSKPPRAQALVPLPRCVELAHRLEMGARDLIKPQVPMLGVRGIPIDGDSGLIVLRAPRSRMAPHRLEMSGIVKECYRRVSDRTEPMTMREIQELTLSAVRGIEKVDARLGELRARFAAWVRESQRADSARIAYRISAVPLSAEPYVERVHGDETVRPISRDVQVTVRGHQHRFHAIGNPFNWRPVLRGTEATDGHGPRGERIVNLSCDGAFTDMTRLHVPREPAPGQRPEYFLYPGWLFGSIICAFWSIDRFRRSAAAEAVQFALEVEVFGDRDLPVLRLNEQWYDSAGTIEGARLQLPTYQLGEPDSWNETINLVWRDFWNSIGVETGEQELTVPW